MGHSGAPGNVGRDLGFARRIPVLYQRPPRLAPTLYHATPPPALYGMAKLTKLQSSSGLF